jgi:hypothetical protein
MTFCFDSMSFKFIELASNISKMKLQNETFKFQVVPQVPGSEAWNVRSSPTHSGLEQPGTAGQAPDTG